MKHIKWLLFAVTCLFLVSSHSLADSSVANDPFNARKQRVKRQAGLMSVLVMAAAAKAVFGGAYIVGSLIKGQRGGNNNNFSPPGNLFCEPSVIFPVH